MEDYKDIYDPDFVQWFNDRFSNFALTPPDPSIEPCLGVDGKVRPRGEWDRGPVFSATKSSSFQFMKHQLLIRDFLTSNSPYRGLLLYHGLGSGKTLTSQAVSENMKNARQVVVMTPASLRENFISELKKGGQYANEVAEAMGHVSSKQSQDKNIRSEILRKYFFISYDASNAPQQVRALPDVLDDKLLIIDEVHNLISMINSKSKKGLFMFETIMNATNLKIIMLSGTPVINDPYEIGIISNMLIGYLDSKGKRHVRPRIAEDKNKHLAFPDNINFYYHFVDDTDPDKPILKNPIKLKRHLTGQISYYAGLQPRDKILPRQTHHLVPIEMSRRQFEMYEKVRVLERQAEAKMRRRLRNSARSRTFGKTMVNLTSLFSTNVRDVVLSNFRSTSRQFSNFAFPPEIPRYVAQLGDVNAKEDDFHIGKHDVEMVNDTGIDAPEDIERSDAEINRIHAESLRMLDEDFDTLLIKELPIHSAKMHAMIQHIMKSPGSVYVYSQFRRLEGVGVFSKVLKAHGFIEYGWGDVNIKPTPMNPLPHTRDAINGRLWGSLTKAEQNSPNVFEIFHPLTYLVWPRSTTNVARRNHLLNVYNCEENKRGDLIRVFLSTKAGAEGINLMNVRQVHIMEPYWNEMRVKQAVGRAIRQCSHATLPPKDRHVDVFHYISTVDTHTTEDKTYEGKPESTDQFVQAIADRKQFIINEVERMMKEVAVDCRLNRAHNRFDDPDIRCFIPNPSMYKAFSIDLTQDPDDAEILGERKAASSVPITIRGQAYLITAIDQKILQAHLKNPNDEPDKKVIDVYDKNGFEIVYKIQLNRGVPAKIIKV